MCWASAVSAGSSPKPCSVCGSPRLCRRRERCLIMARFDCWPLTWRKKLGGIDVWPCGIVCCSLCGLTYPPSIHAGTHTRTFSPPSRCLFATQGLLPPVAVLGSASPCPCVALWGSLIDTHAHTQTGPKPKNQNTKHRSSYWVSPPGLPRIVVKLIITIVITRADIFSFDFLLKEKNLLIPAAAGFFSLDATSGLLATASASAPAMFLALRSALLCVCVYDMRDENKIKNDANKNINDTSSINDSRYKKKTHHNYNKD